MISAVLSFSAGFLLCMILLSKRVMEGKQLANELAAAEEELELAKARARQAEQRLGAIRSILLDEQQPHD